MGQAVIVNLVAWILNTYTLGVGGIRGGYSIYRCGVGVIALLNPKKAFTKQGRKEWADTYGDCGYDVIAKVGKFTIDIGVMWFAMGIVKGDSHSIVASMTGALYSMVSSLILILDQMKVINITQWLKNTMKG